MLKLRPTSRRGQVTLIDLVMAPIVAVVLSLLAVFFLTTQTSNLITAVNQEPYIQSCNFALSQLYGNYYVHTASLLNNLSLTYPSEYSAALSQQSQTLSTSCGPGCSTQYQTVSNSLSNSSSLYANFINYFSSFSLSTFDNIEGANIATLSALHMRVFLNQVPSTVSGSTVCSISVYNPANPSKPYTVFGVIS